MARILPENGQLYLLVFLALSTTLVASALAQGDCSSATTQNGNSDVLFAPPSEVSQPVTAYVALPKSYNMVRTAHATLAGIAWLVFFPLGGILIRVLETPNVVWIHSAVQGIGSLLFVVGAGCGIWMARVGGVASNWATHSSCRNSSLDLPTQIGQYHPIIGLSLLGTLLIQPTTELLNHFLYQKYPKIIWAAHIHLWFGHLLITVGITQGGFGFVFSASLPGARQENWPKLLYGITATVVWILYMAGAVVWPMVRHTFPPWVARKQAREAREAEEMLQLTG